jgi:hypothetical protein
VGELERVLEVAEAVAAALDVEDVVAVQQADEDGSGQDLVAGVMLPPMSGSVRSSPMRPESLNLKFTRHSSTLRSFWS